MTQSINHFSPIHHDRRLSMPVSIILNHPTPFVPIVPEWRRQRLFRQISSSDNFKTGHVLLTYEQPTVDECWIKSTTNSNSSDHLPAIVESIVLLPALTSKQLWVLFCILTIQLAYNCYVALLPAFFTPVAINRGLNEFQCSFVFAITPAIGVFVTPFMDRHLVRLGVRFPLVIGLLFNAIAAAAFGFIDQFLTGNAYLVSCLSLRVLEALGTCAVSVCSYMCFMEIFPDRANFTFGLFHSSIGLGLSFGPLLGGLLISCVGYQMTFSIYSVIILLCIPFALCALSFPKQVNTHHSDLSAMFCKDLASTALPPPPSPSSPSSSTMTTNGDNNLPVSSYLQILLNVHVLPVAWVLLLTSSCLTFVDPILEPQLKKFDLSPQKVGFEFFLFTASYSIFAALAGTIVGNASIGFKLMITGLIAAASGFLLLGSNFAIVSSNVLDNTIGLFGLGVGIGLGLVPTFQILINNIVDLQCDVDVIQTQAKVATLTHTLVSSGYVTLCHVKLATVNLN